MLLITELENLSIARNDVASVSESLEPPVKIAKMSIGSSRIQQLLESAQQVSRIDETAASKILMVNYLKFDQTMIFQEVDSYLREPLIDYSEDSDCILEYWKVSSYSLLKFIAKKFLCPPPSSAESERTFSGLGNIYTDKRNRLTSEHANMQLFLHHVYKNTQ